MPNVSELISQILLKKLREESLTRQEAATLAEWEGRSPEHAEFIAMLMDEASLSGKIKGMLELDEQSAWQRIERALAVEWNERSAPQKRKISWYKYAAAASVMLVLGFGVYYFLSSKSPVSEQSKSAKPDTGPDIAPGNNRAVLTLADGSVTDLETIPDGVISEQEGFIVVKTQGRLALEKADINNFRNVRPDNTSNILRTPRGGQYQVQLGDGTVVWLNAASSLKFPTSFYENERIVELSGEAYFEVAKDSQKRFRIIVNTASGYKRAEIEVMGTHFNVMAFDEEKAVITTLLEGKIKLSAKNKVILSLPGQQARLTESNEIRLVKNADTAHAISWKGGYFDFSESPIKDVMNQIVRWYNVSIFYEDSVNPQQTITGKIPRSLSLKNLIKVLRLTEINCNIDTSKENTSGAGRIIIEAVK